MATGITGAQINEVIRLVQRLTPDGDAQLSILARALVVGCQSTRVSKAVCLAEVGGIFDQPANLIRLDADLQP